MSVQPTLENKIEKAATDDLELINTYDECTYRLIEYSHATKHAYIQIEGGEKELVGYEQLRENYNFTNQSDS